MSLPQNVNAAMIKNVLALTTLILRQCCNLHKSNQVPMAWKAASQAKLTDILNCMKSHPQHSPAALLRVTETIYCFKYVVSYVHIIVSSGHFMTGISVH